MKSKDDVDKKLIVSTDVYYMLLKFCGTVHPINSYRKTTQIIVFNMDKNNILSEKKNSSST